MWFIGVEVEQETSAPPPKKNPGSAPEITTEHASYSPVTFVTHKRFAVLFFPPSCCVNSLLLSAINNWAKGKIGYVNLFLWHVCIVTATGVSVEA